MSLEKEESSQKKVTVLEKRQNKEDRMSAGSRLDDTLKIKKKAIYNNIVAINPTIFGNK